MVSSSHKRIWILGCLFSYARKSKVDQFLLDAASRSESGYVCVSNVHTTMMAYFDADYRRIQNSSLLTVPDGMPIVWGMNFCLGRNQPSQDRVRGPDLMRRLCAQGVARGVKHYLFGGTESTLQALKKTLEKEAPGIQIVGIESPPFRPFTPTDLSEAAQRINATGAQFVWVGLGAPKQEKWMDEQRQQVRGLMMGVGAAFDILPGVVSEAPEVLQNLGLEWIYRLYQEPRRLWKRYLWNNPAFLFLFAVQIVKGKLFSKSYLCEIRNREDMGDF